MDLDAVKRSLELDPDPSSSSSSSSPAAELPPSFYDAFVLHGLRIDAAEPRRVLCSLSVPPRLANSESYLHSGVIATLADVVGSAVFYSSGFPTSGVSLEISISYLDAAFINEEIEIEAKLLRVGKAVGVTSIEFRKKNTGKIIAQARHSKYLAVSSKL
ncbi:acyl-coenzyme A thioesterase 13-like [Ananas comosus]|uniref:Acyl-coenzyme A thioesterase 13 n=1 Tax=Ananas comosus TaxID=4615 RepID=A0A6P5EEL0_ANACO|nr:acyl-coenzyme A thioesterase 13-like [Ananas comosus]XP_020112306.1 acyl-coenzyme A thioesterase 13-like [Ananas comosus]